MENGKRTIVNAYVPALLIFHSQLIINHYPGPWPSGKASPLQGEDRRFESDRVHTAERNQVFAKNLVSGG